MATSTKTTDDLDAISRNSLTPPTISDCKIIRIITE